MKLYSRIPPKVRNSQSIAAAGRVFSLARSYLQTKYPRLYHPYAFTSVVAVILAVSVGLSPVASASTMGPYSPTAGADNSGTGTITWSSPTNIYSQNAVYASASVSSAATTHYLTAEGYAFTIPATAVINGVSATVYEYAGTSSKAKITDNAVKLVVGGAITGTSQASTATWPSANTAVTYGGTSNLWGATLTPANVNASNFGVAISALNTKVSGGGSALSANVDYVSVSITYTIPVLYNQAAYRWFQDTTGTPAPIVAQNTAMTAPAGSFRLRMLLGVSNAALASSGQNFQLAEAQLTSGSCTSSLTYTPVTATSSIAFHTNTSITDGSAMSTSASDPTDGANTVVAQDYLSSQTSFTNNQASIAAGQDGEWDISLYNYGAAAGTSWCFEVQKSGGTALDTYTQFPQLTVPSGSISQAGYRWFQNTNSLPSSYPVSEPISASPGIDAANSTAIDTSGGFRYDVGYDSNTASNFNEWRIEKRGLTTGALVTGFGTSGAISEHISSSQDIANSIAIDASGGYMYVVGYDGSPGSSLSEWRIEKRLLTTGALVTGFGTSGAISEHISTSNDMAESIAIDPTGGYMYVAGYDETPGPNEWRIEKRLLTTGALVTGFGTSGAISEHISSGTNSDVIDSIAIDPSGGNMYVAGYDETPGYQEWRIEKRLLTTGALVTGFGTSGAISESISASYNIAYSIAIDPAGGYMYLTGYDNNKTGNKGEWRLEDRSLSTGANYSGSIGTPLAAMNTATNQFFPGDIVRLRLLIGVGGVPIAVNGYAYKLQVASANNSCSNNLVYSDIPTSGGAVNYYANSNLTDGMAMTSSANDPTDGSNTIVPQDYIQTNTNFNNNQTALVPTQDGEWDIALQIDPVLGFGGYCFRAVTSTGSLLTTYTVFPQLGAHPNPDLAMNHGQTVINGQKSPLDSLKP